MDANEREEAFVAAVEKGAVDETRRLLAAHPDLIHCDFGGYTALHAVATEDYLDLMKLLIESGCDVNAEQEFPRERTALLSAVLADKVATAQFADHRAFDRLPILADALEDAGCTDPDILAHCRGPGLHVRGCWVVDLLTGRC